MAMVEPTDPNEASNYRMGRNPIVGEPQGGEMLKPTLPEGILPLYLAKVHPEAMAAAGAAGAEAVAAMPPAVQEVTNVDLPREDQRHRRRRHGMRRSPHRIRGSPVR